MQSRRLRHRDNSFFGIVDCDVCDVRVFNFGSRQRFKGIDCNKVLLTIRRKDVYRSLMFYCDPFSLLS